MSARLPVHLSRRRVAAAIAAVLVVGLAGCSAGDAVSG